MKNNHATYLAGEILAEELGYFVREYESPLKSFSATARGITAIAINHVLLEPREDVVAIFHEIGHCETASFYNQYTSREIFQKHENRADRWAIKKLIPKDELDVAVSNGLTEPWQLADYFNVTEDFMKKAMCLYTHGNLATDLYF